VQRDLVPPFATARKTLAMMAGHVHSYERFERSGKLYVVAGGGGGPRARLSAGERRRHADDLFEGPSLRFFHYLSCRLETDALDVEVRGLDKHGDAMVTRDRFSLPLVDRPLGEAP
jgi:hypothetical protein